MRRLGITVGLEQKVKFVVPSAVVPAVGLGGDALVIVTSLVSYLTD